MEKSPASVSYVVNPPARLAHKKLAQVTALIRSTFLGLALITPYWHMACIYLGLACWAESREIA